MSDAVIHLDKIIDKLPDPECCGEVEALLYYGSAEEDRRIKDRPNNLSCWYCNGCGSTWSPVVADEGIIFIHYDSKENESKIVDVLENGFKWT